MQLGSSWQLALGLASLERMAKRMFEDFA